MRLTFLRDIVKRSIWVDPAGQKPNTIDPDLVMHVLRKHGKIT